MALSSTKTTKVIISLSVLLSIAIANRWIVTPLGLESYGRVWYLFVNYWDLGFARRSLEGSLLTLLRLNRLLENPYHFAVLYHSAKIIILGLLTYRLIVIGNIKDRLAVFVVAFSPAFILHYGYETGSTDVSLAILSLFLVIYRMSNLVFSAGLVAGVLIHDVFLFFVPAIIIIRFFRSEAESPSFTIFAKHVFFHFLAPMAVVILLIISAKNAPDKAWFENLMSGYLGVAVNKHPLWSGYVELYRGIEGNIEESNKYRSLSDIFSVPVLIPAFYVAVLLYIVYSEYKKLSSIGAAVLIISLCFPLISFAFATDLYRFVSYTGSLSIIAMTIGWKSLENDRPLNHYALWACAALVVTGPLGNFPLNDPYPLLRFLITKLL